MNSENDFDKGVDAYEKGDHETAFRLLKPLAEQGHAEAQYAFGVMHYHAHGVQKNLVEAASWIHKAAEQGHAEARYSLGVMHAYGKGVPQNFFEAAEWLDLAAYQGHQIAQLRLGLMYDCGFGMPQNDCAAVEWYRCVTEARGWRHGWAYYYLGVMYASGGDDVPKDEDKAEEYFRGAKCRLLICRRAKRPKPRLVAPHQTAKEFHLNDLSPAVEKWLRFAASHAGSAKGRAKAHFYLGEMICSGWGREEDREEGLEWFRKAAEQGHEGAQQALKKMGE